MEVFSKISIVLFMTFEIDVAFSHDSVLRAKLEETMSVNTYTQPFVHKFNDGKTFRADTTGTELRDDEGTLLDFENTEIDEVRWTTEAGSPVDLAAQAAGLVPATGFILGPSEIKGVVYIQVDGDGLTGGRMLSPKEVEALGVGEFSQGLHSYGVETARERGVELVVNN
jgi:hypothetical protein